MRSVVIHAHFYQPPREDPWLDEVETEPSAAPHHDWNTRIERECYRAVVASRVPGAGGRIARILNTLSWISFNVGATLFEWLEKEALGTYQAMLEADAESRRRLGGHGNAIAMPYHHAILPLSSRRDKTTEVRWGVADFRRRFGREPAGMWLPETAVDEETLDVLAQEGLAFTILAPHQVARAPARGLPGRYRTASGRSLAIFVYDGELSAGVAFGPLLKDGRAFAQRLLAGDRARALASVATDGETYGHHHRFGEMALAAALEALAERGAVVENFAAFLARHPPAEDVTLVSPSSWSCAHGVERWRADCGCRVHREVATNQRWRVGLRQAVDWLAGELHALYEAQASGCFADPWAMRDAYGTAATQPLAARALVKGALKPGADPLRALELLEMERQTLRTFTSCGWFFDDLAGIESLQVLRYAARGIELAGPEAGVRLEAGLLRRLETAVSNQPASVNGAELYRTRVKPARAAAARVAAGHRVLTWLSSGRPVSLAGFRVSGEGDHVAVEDARTGRRRSFTAEVTRAGGAGLEVRVRGEGADARFGMSELPERYAEAARATLRERLVGELLGSDAVLAAAAEGRGPADLAEAELVSAVVALGSDSGAAAQARVLALADLLELYGRTIPFDAQTAFYRLGDPSLKTVAARLGFTGDAAAAR